MLNMVIMMIVIVVTTEVHHNHHHRTAANHLSVSPLVLEKEEFTLRDLIYSNCNEKI